MVKSNIELLEQKLERCRNTNIEDVDINEIEDVADIFIDTQKSSVERILDFLFSVKNPYVFKVKDKIVKIEFSKNNVYAKNCVTNVFKNIYK